MDYRKLVDKLDKIASRQILNELKIGDINPETGKRVTGGMTDSSGNLVSSGTPGLYWNYKEEPVAAPTPSPAPTPEPPKEEPVVTPVQNPTDIQPTPLDPIKEPEGPTCTPEIREKIKYAKTFSQAYAMAKSSGCDPFEWCGVYTTQGGQDTKPTEPPAATGNTSVYGQGVQMAVSRAKAKGLIGKTGPYTQADVDKVIAGLQDGSLGHQMDTKSGVASSAAATMGQQIKDLLLKGNRLASVDQTGNQNRFYPGVTK